MLTLIGLLVFLAYYVQILNLFLVDGAYFLDVGWLSWLLSQPDPTLPNPPTIAESWGASYYGVHISPVLAIWGLIASALGLDNIGAFAAFQGALHLLLFAVGYSLAGALDIGSRPFGFCVRLVVGLSLAFSPIALDSIGYPHFEMATPGLFLAALVLAARQRCRLALVAFLGMLLVREDAGFHAACFLWAYALAAALQDRRWRGEARAAFVAGGAALACGLATLAIQKSVFPALDAFASTYAGNPYFGHVSLELLATNLAVLAELRPELFVILALPAVAYVLDRDLRHLAGTLGVLPWLLLHLLAVRQEPSTLFSYYAAPFLITGIWPFVVLALRTRRAEPRTIAPRRFLAWRSAFVLLAFLLFFWTPLDDDGGKAGARWHVVRNFEPRFTLAQAANVRDLASELLPYAGDGGPLVSDAATMSLMPGAATRRQEFRESELDARQAPYLLVHFTRYMQARRVVGSPYFAAATFCYRLRETPIELRGTLDASQMLPALASRLRPIACN